MKIVVIGGTGLIGSKLVEKLRRDGHEPLAAAPNTGVNTLTGEGLAEALDGAQAVVDVAHDVPAPQAARMAASQRPVTHTMDAPVGTHASRAAVPQATAVYARHSTAPRRPGPIPRRASLPPQARRGRRADAAPRLGAMNGKAEMTTPTTSPDPLVEALATRLRLIDLIGWQRIAMWAEQSELSFEDLRLLLAMALKMDDGPVAVSELGDLAGFSLDVAYPATHSLRRRGYLREERRQYTLSQQGQELVARLDAARREGIQAYVDQLDREERERLCKAFAITR
jgi:uncharacterized protein YbjT (DUF2867 family)